MIVKLKQIEFGGRIAVMLDTPLTTVTFNSGLPPSFNGDTRELSLPSTPTLTVSGNTATYNPNDGSPPIAYTPTFPADAFLTAGVYNAFTQSLELTLSNGNTVVVPASALAGVVTTNSTSIAMGGDGTPAAPLQAGVLIGSGVGNQLVSSPTGLFVPPTTILAVDSATVALGGNGGLTALTAKTKLQPDSGFFTRNFLGSPALATSATASLLGLGYTEVPFRSGVGAGVGPFDVTGAIALYTAGWTSVDILQVEGKINGVYYDVGWNFTTPTAYTWANIAGGAEFDLDATDEVTFVIKLRAGT